MTKIVVASSRPWYTSLASELSRRGGVEVVSISEKEEFTRQRLEAEQPRYVFLPHWSHIIPDEIHENFECVIFHMTDLPFGRGGSPLQNLIARGIYETKISALRCVRQLDAGPIYLKRDLSLHGSAEEIFLRAATVIGDMLLTIIRDNPEPQPQQGEVTTFKRRRPEDGNMETLSSLDEVFDYIRMLDAEGYPAAFFEIGNFRMEFSRASRRQDSVTADVRITQLDAEGEAK